MVLRMSVACTTERRSSAAVSASRSKPSSRDHRPTYIDGAYCAWIPAIRSSARGSGVRARSSSSWRASSARLSSRSVSVRTARPPQAHVHHFYGADPSDLRHYHLAIDTTEIDLDCCVDMSTNGISSRSASRGPTYAPPAP